MENLLHSRKIGISRQAINHTEECPISGEYTLPDYCPDMAMVMKCLVTPLVQNRQWSGDRILIDGLAVVRVLYLDEDRCCVRSVEFTQPLSCSMAVVCPGEDMAPICLDLHTKYVNCRAVTPRRLEIRGAVCVHAFAECESICDIKEVAAETGLNARWHTGKFTIPVGFCEKVLTVNEALEFPESLPGAEMLLGGECKAVVTECKLLTGKAIVKGQIYVHQLYTDNLNSGTTHCLDYVLPFSQIMDVDGATDSLPYDVNVLLLSDTERCSVGPDGGNTMLDVTVKLLFQLQVYQGEEIPLLTDAYHNRYPLSVKTEDCVLQTHIGCRMEQTLLPLKVELPAGPLQEIIDVWVQLGNPDGVCDGYRVTLTDRLTVCLLLRDGDGQIQYYERPEEYRLEYPCEGNWVKARLTATELHYRVCDGNLELQITVCVKLKMGYTETVPVICDAVLCKDSPYPTSRANVLMYYAQPGEDVWEIGRCCHTTPEGIQKENDLSDGPLQEPTLLVVPIVS